MSNKEFEVFTYTCKATIKCAQKRRVCHGGTKIRNTAPKGVTTNEYSRGMAAKLIAEKMGA